MNNGKQLKQLVKNYSAATTPAGKVRNGEEVIAYARANKAALNVKVFMGIYRKLTRAQKTAIGENGFGSENDILRSN